MDTLFLFALIMVGGMLAGWTVATLTSLVSKDVAIHNPILPGLASLGIAMILIKNSAWANDPNWLFLSSLGILAGIFGWIGYSISEATPTIPDKKPPDRVYRDKRS